MAGNPDAGTHEASMGKTMILAADHAGFVLKEALKPWLGELGLTVIDAGCHSEDAVDYPLIAAAFAEEMKARAADFGIAICGSGVGISIGVNRFDHIRAALASDETTARLSRQHNDANVLCLGSRLVAPELARQIIATWLATPFEGGRHQRRVDQLGALHPAPASQSC